MQTTREVQNWFWRSGTWIQAEDILWYWSKGTLWFIVVDQPKRSMAIDTLKGYVSIARTHNKDGSPIRLFEHHDEIPIEEAPANFRMMLKSYGSASGVQQAEQLAEAFYLALKSETAQQKSHMDDLVESLSVGFSNVEIKQCQKEARERLEDENYDELDLVKAILGGNVDAVKHCIDSGSYELDTTYSPLHLAAICGSSKMVVALINAGVDINQEDSNGQTVLHYLLNSEIDDMAFLLIFSKNMTTVEPLMRCIYRLVLGEYGHGAKAIERSSKEEIACWANAAKRQRLCRSGFGRRRSTPDGVHMEGTVR